MDEKKFRSDVVVVGGGVSGVIAAVCAASAGASVVLVEKEIYLGGIAVGALMGQFVGCGLDNTPTFCGKSKELVDELFRENAAAYYKMPTRTRKGNILLLRYNIEVLGKKLEDMVKKAAVRVFYSTQLLEAKEEENGCRIKALGVNSLLEFHCSYVIDATGSAALVNAMGFETHILPVEERMPSALLFKLGNVDIEKVKDFDWVKVRKPWFEEGVLPAEHLALAIVPNSNEIIVNATNYCPFDEESSEDVAFATMELENQIREMFPIFKERIPGLENSSITAIARKLGVREARRIVGEFVLTADQILSETKFEDAVAVGSWPIDRNLPDGRNIWTETEKPYQIPYRALLPKNAKRVITAGRSISVDDTAYSATRVIPTTMGIGEAAGVATVLAMHKDKPFNSIDGKEVSAILKQRGIKLDW